MTCPEVFPPVTELSVVDMDAEITALRVQLEAAHAATDVALEAAKGWQRAAAEAQAREARLRSMFLLLAEFTTPLPGFSMEGLYHQFTAMTPDDKALVAYGQQERANCVEALRALRWPAELEDAVGAICECTGECAPASTAEISEAPAAADIELSHIDPEAAQPEERALHLVSGTSAGRAYNDLCRMLGGRWPDCRLEREAPVAHKFFRALMTPHHLAESANSPRAAA